MEEGRRYVQSWISSRRTAKTEYVNHPHSDQTLAQNTEVETPLGRPCEITFARIAGKLWTLLDGKIVLQAADPDSVPARLILDCLHNGKFRAEKVEYLNLDGVPEAEALKLAGVPAAQTSR
jgi:hypothetical protein